MMLTRKSSREAVIAASHSAAEREYWLNHLAGELPKSSIPPDYLTAAPGKISRDGLKFQLTDGKAISSRLIKWSNESDLRLHIILTAALLILLHKYTHHEDLIIGTPIYKQDTETDFINTVLVLRNQLHPRMTCRELILKVSETVARAEENQNYPIERLVSQLNVPDPGTGSPFFDIVLLLENVHDKKYIQHLQPHIIFSFKRTGEQIEGELQYNSLLYHESSMKRIIRHLRQLLFNLLENVNAALVEIDILTPEERQQLLVDFNNTEAEYPAHKAIQQLFAEQTTRTPGHIAVISGNPSDPALSYLELNQKSNQLARVLQRMGVTTETVVGIMMERSPQLIIALLAILKAGGAYLPILPQSPRERVLHMLDDAGAEVVISTSAAHQGVPFTSLQNFAAGNYRRIKATPPRIHIKDFDRLSIPDRSLINLENYKNKIGMASVTNAISLQATRGCPYECLYCHKIWSKHHMFRSAENIYKEIRYYYEQGVTHFAFIDDCFNLSSDISRRLFQLLIKNRITVRLFFPNGLRGDLLTPGYIDLMVEAGTSGINLSLETASPRLQKRLKKNLNLEKFKTVVDYIAGAHPQVILELATMHGFPGETEAEAMMTLDFIKSIKWLHFPYIHILKIFPNTEMEAFALEQGVAKENIMISKDRAFHELPETLPFPKSFTRKYQANFLNEYFLARERLQKVLPHQMKILNETALVQKYNAYLPVEIKSLEDLLRFTQLTEVAIPPGYTQPRESPPPIFAAGIKAGEPPAGAKKILFLDLSQHFSSYHMLYNVVEQPLGMIYLLTYLKQHFKDEIDGRIYKSGNDFDSFDRMRKLIREYNPDMIGIRTLTFFQEFFHTAVSLIRQWGIDIPIITGGPYASSDYDTILKDENIDLVVFGEGEYTLEELIREMLKNDFRLPSPVVLEKIPGIAYRVGGRKFKSRQVVLPEQLEEELAVADPGNLPVGIDPAGSHLAYVMYTSGSTGRPKGVMVEHRQVNNCIFWMQRQFNWDETAVTVQRTNLTFDPSVWEIFWPLYTGGAVMIISQQQSRDAEYLIGLMSGAEAGGKRATVMYCPAGLLTVIVYLLNTRVDKPVLTLPLLIIGAEPIGMEVVKNFYRYYRGRIVNTYGPTEGTINNTYYELTPDEPRSIVPIGKPIANNRVYILSGDLHLLPVNMAGEICLAGDSIARGYIRNQQKTGECFIQNPFGSGKLYKTGDLGRWLEDGNIEIMGRIDEQVKIRGYRIELGEIENALLTHEAVNESVVVVKDSQELRGKNRECKKCGIWSNYPGITINDEGICRICENFDRYEKLIRKYFLTMEDLELKIKQGNKHKKSKYDCLLVYACERVATYALYRLLEMGVRVLTVTYDSGHYEPESMARITAITQKLGVDHLFLTHRRSADILKESLRTAATMCKGCIHTSSALAGEYAYQQGIKFVIGETLSRGQIVENKLQKFIEMGIDNLTGLEREIEKLQRNTPLIDKRIFDLIDIKGISDGSLYDNVEFIDFYRYCDVTNQEMIEYLDSKDPYWKGLGTVSTYSTDCKICQVGNFNYLEEKGYHYTGSAKSWDQRLGVTTLTDLKEDLKIHLSAHQHEQFLAQLGYQVHQGKGGENSLEQQRRYLCAYYVSDRDLAIPQLREYLTAKIPDYMIPTHFTRLREIPLTPNGKLDRRALPLPEGFRLKQKETYIAPKTGMEKLIADTWQEILKLDMVGIADNFFELGGNSIDIVIMGSKLKEKLNKEIPVVTLFTYPTIQSLASHIDQPVPEAARGITRAEPSPGEDQREEAKNRLRQSFMRRKSE